MNIKKFGTILWASLLTLFIIALFIVGWDMIEVVIYETFAIISRLGAISAICSIVVYFVQRVYFDIIRSKTHIIAAISITETLLDKALQIEMKSALSQLKKVVRPWEKLKKKNGFKKEVNKRKYRKGIDNVSDAIVEYCFALLRNDLTSTDKGKKEVAQNIIKKIQFIAEQPLVAKKKRDDKKKELEREEKRKKREKLASILKR